MARLACPVGRSKRKRSSTPDVKQESIKEENIEVGNLEKIPIKEEEHGSPATTPYKPRKRANAAASQTPSAPKMPSKAVLKKEEAAKKKQWKGDWEEWVKQSFWVEDPKYRQKAGSLEIHRSEAMIFHRLKGQELDTLPHWECENQHNLAQPGKSYSHEGVLMLASRKCAVLAGLHEQEGINSDVLIRQGRRLFHEDQMKLFQRTPTKQRHPKTMRIRARNYHNPVDERILCGAWETREWRDGKVVGYWLNYQYDSDVSDCDVVSCPIEERFRPV